MVRSKIYLLLKKFGLKHGSFSIVYPPQKEFGDYSVVLSLKTAKELKRKIEKIKPVFLEKIEVAGPGFLNFYLKKEFFQKQIREILKKGEKFGNINLKKEKKVQIEFISANPTGPLTIGNARGGPFGDTLANVFKKVGFEVKRAYYVNDLGNQILALGHSILEDKEAQYKGDYIDELGKIIKEKDPKEAGKKAAKMILNRLIKKTVKKLGIKYDDWFFESRLHQTSFVEKTIEILKKKKLTFEKEGALWFLSSKLQDKRDRVLIKKDKSKTYLCNDIAYHRYKFEKQGFDKVIDIWGADHSEDVAGLQAGLKALGYKGKLEVILLQFVTLLEKGKRVKMSKRKGEFVTMDELLKKVGKDVVRFFFLQRSAGTHLNFDLDLAKQESEKNPVFYVQYAHTRICGILRKFGKSQIPGTKSFTPLDSKHLTGQANPKSKILNSKLKLLNHQSELNLIKQLIKFPEVIEDTAKDYQLQRLPKYALDLATIFHQFYRDCKVLSENQSLSQARLALILATKIVLQEILSLMGISAPERM